ncbi:MAG: oligopeptide transporter, OPT family [Planctomycetes bacterium]|nr:oligopeptide transporter, OPT family [Planctomycetota bacterium]
MSENSQSPRELTVRVFFFGVILSVLLSAANAYLGLFAGMTVSAAIPAAVMALGIMRFFRNSTIYECNLIGTCASAGESLAAGVIFTLPALLLLGFWEQFSYTWVALIAGFGGLLGTLFTIPLRRSLIVETKLQFPEGVATAKVLETGRKDTSGIKYIVQAALAGGLFKIGANALGIWPEIMQGARRMGGSILYFGSNLSPALLSVGYIVGLNIALLMFVGGAINWYVAIPVVSAQNEWPQYQLLNRNVPQEWTVAGGGFVVVDPNDPKAWDSRTSEARAWNAFVLETRAIDPNASPADANSVRAYNDKVLAKLGQPVPAKDYAQRIWSKRTRYAGVGGMLIGGLWTIFRLRKSLVSGMTSGLNAYKQLKEGKGGTDRLERDLPMQWIIGMIVGSIVPLFLVYQHYVQQVHISLIMAFVMLGTGFLFAAVAGYMAGLVGSSNNPISGVTVSTVLVASVLLVLLMGKSAVNGPAAAIIVGAVICCAAAIAGDVMQDLKCGRLVGTTPWKQQVMEMVGTASASLTIGPVLILLQGAYGFAGMKDAGSKALSSPQANLMASVARGVFEGGLPWTFVIMGMIAAVGIIALDQYLQARKCSFRVPILAVAIGFYLPFQLSVPIFVGGLISVAVARFHKRNKSDAAAMEGAERRGLLIASGLITGEAIMGILVAIPIVILKQYEIEMPLWEGMIPLGGPLGVALLAFVAFWLYRATVSEKRS